MVVRNGQLSKLCYYGETLVTKGSLLELWYSGSELLLALFPESNGSLVSATGVPRDSCGIRGTNIDISSSSFIWELVVLSLAS